MYNFIKMVKFLYLVIEYMYFSIPLNNILILFQERLQWWRGEGIPPHDFNSF